MYGFVNETAWEFGSAIAVCNLVFFSYSVIMDVIYIKFNLTLFVIRTTRASYDKYDKLKQTPTTKVEWKRYCTPVYLTIVLAVLIALTHWLMMAIIGVRIYVDNFTIDKDDINNAIPDTGDYKVAPFTWYMMVCTIYLPILSWVAYIRLNRLWFHEVYADINQLNVRANQMPPHDTWDKKLLSFVKDPSAYIAVVFLMLPFVAFTVGAFLLDYDSSDYEVSESARNCLQDLGVAFIAFFALSNLQASIFFIILVAAIIAVLLFGLPVLCVVVCYNLCSK